MKNDKNLDNPVWFSLSETHQSFALDFGNIKFYDPDYCPFGAPGAPGDASTSIGEYGKMVHDFFIVGVKPVLPGTLILKKELVCIQMILGGKINSPITNTIVKLTDQHTGDLCELVNLVQPGFFKIKTALLGNYFGIFKNGQLVAVTGERMKMSRYVEVSAIVTHPGHTRQGYARQLITHTANAILSENKTPYLHVVEDNSSAIKLYEKLGFTTRRKISFWNISTQG